jgi:hypothetical protein
MHGKKNQFLRFVISLAVAVAMLAAFTACSDVAGNTTQANVTPTTQAKTPTVAPTKPSQSDAEICGFGNKDSEGYHFLTCHGNPRDGLRIWFVDNDNLQTWVNINGSVQTGTASIIQKKKVDGVEYRLFESFSIPIVIVAAPNKPIQVIVFNNDNTATFNNHLITIYKQPDGMKAVTGFDIQ